MTEPNQKRSFVDFGALPQSRNLALSGQNNCFGSGRAYEGTSTSTCPAGAAAPSSPGARMRAHFTICAKRPAASDHMDRRGRNPKPSAAAHRGGECSVVGAAQPDPRRARCARSSPCAQAACGLTTWTDEGGA
jgi:hypothetical protein